MLDVTTGSVLTTDVSQCQLSLRVTLKVRLGSCLSLLSEWTTLIAPKWRYIPQFVNGRGSSRMEASVASPTSPHYVGQQLTALFQTQPLFSFLVYWCVTPTINCVFQLKPSPALEAPGHGHLLGHHTARDRAYSTNSLGHCGLSAVSTRKLTSESTSRQ